MNRLSVAFTSETSIEKGPKHIRQIDCKTILRGCPRNSGKGKFWTFTDFSNIFSESRPFYPMNKYHIYLDQIFYFYFLRGGFHYNLKTTQFPFEDSII